MTNPAILEGIWECQQCFTLRVLEKKSLKIGKLCQNTHRPDVFIKRFEKKKLKKNVNLTTEYWVTASANQVSLQMLRFFRFFPMQVISKPKENPTPMLSKNGKMIKQSQVLLVNPIKVIFSNKLFNEKNDVCFFFWKIHLCYKLNF